MSTTISKRVTSAPVWTFHTSRISFLLALEGDESGVLLLEGDTQTDVGTQVDTDALRLEGDATAIAANHTKRVTEPVT